MCGIVGVISPSGDPVIGLVYEALLALQHRGQDAAGIVTEDAGRLCLHKDNGMVRDVFGPEQLRALRGEAAVRARDAQRVHLHLRGRAALLLSRRQLAAEQRRLQGERARPLEGGPPQLGEVGRLRVQQLQRVLASASAAGGDVRSAVGAGAPPPDQSLTRCAYLSVLMECSQQT